MCYCSIVEHDGERFKSESLHKKLPEDPLMREDLDVGKRQRSSARISRSKTNASSVVRKRVKPMAFASQLQLNSNSVPATPIGVSVEDFFSGRISSSYVRHGSLDEDHHLMPHELHQQLASALVERPADGDNKETEEATSGSITSIEEENEMTMNTTAGSVNIIAEEVEARETVAKMEKQLRDAQRRLEGVHRKKYNKSRGTDSETDQSG